MIQIMPTATVNWLTQQHKEQIKTKDRETSNNDFQQLLDVEMEKLDEYRGRKNQT